MQEVIGATKVRKNFGSFIDQVVHSKPLVVKRNRDYLAAISLAHLDFLLTPYQFTLDYEIEADGSYSGSLKEIDLVINAPSLEELKTEIAQELMEYAIEYMNEFEMYYNASNRKVHFPYVLRLIIQKDNDSIRGLINA